MTNIGDLIRELAKSDDEIYSVICTVSSIKEDKATLKPLNGTADLLEVKLIAGDSETPFLITPVIGSVVIATFTSKDTAFISLYSEVESVKIRGDKYGGLVRVEELVSKINTLEDKINDLIQKFNSHTHLYAPGPSAPVPSAPVTTLEVPIPVKTSRGDIENDLIKHG